jgi:molybdate transport system substrate-binding protein
MVAKLGGLILFLGFAMLAASGAQAAESVVLSAAAMRMALAERPPEGYEPGDSDKPTTFGTAGEMFDAAVAGKPFDVIILPPARLDVLAQRGIVDARTIHPLGVMHLAAAVRHGSSHPDVATEAQLRATLLATPSLAVADPATGATTGIYLAQLFEKMGLAADLKPRLKLYPDGQAAMEAVAHGDVALAIGQASEAAPVAGLDDLGPLPDSIQLKTTYAAAIAAHPVDRGMAERTMARLLSPSFRSILMQQGFTIVP